MCGAVVGILIFGIVLAGVIAEAHEFWHEGVSAFFADAAGRLVVGALVATIFFVAAIVRKVRVSQAPK